MKIVRTKDLDWSEGINKGKFLQRKKPLAGTAALSASVWELPPGRKSFPLHAHHVTEEAMYVISGRARVRTSDGEHHVGPGDYVYFPAGGTAHQLINDSEDEAMVYLGLSSSKGVDIVEYPDGDKVASAVGVWPNVKRFIFKKADGADYFDGEKDAE